MKGLLPINILGGAGTKKLNLLKMLEGGWYKKAPLAQYVRRGWRKKPLFTEDAWLVGIKRLLYILRGASTKKLFSLKVLVGHVYKKLL